MAEMAEMAEETEETEKVHPHCPFDYLRCMSFDTGIMKYRRRKCLRTCQGHVQKTGVSMYNDGHESYKDTWICDYCDKSHDKEEMMHHCGKCKYDFCEGCFTGVEVQNDKFLSITSVMKLCRVGR